MRCINWVVILVLCASPVLAEGVLTPAATPPQPMTVISVSGIPFIKAPSGSMGNNGAVSGMTALPKTYGTGAYLYLPTNAIVAGSAAGWYWFVASSTTAGTVYNSTYTSGHPRPGIATAFATTGPGAFTGTTGAITAISLTVPANAMGIQGRTVAEFGYAFNNTGGNKINAVTFGGTACFTVTSTTQVSFSGRCEVTNRGVTNRQALSSVYTSASGGTIGTVAGTDATVATTSDTTVALTMNVAVATDYSIVEEYSVYVLSVN